MSKCVQCNQEHQGKGKYCSTACKSKYHREKAKLAPSLSATNPVNSAIENSVSNALGDYAGKSINNALPSIPPQHRNGSKRGIRKELIAQMASSGLGAILGYTLSKDKENKFMYAGIGAGAAFFVYQFVDVAFDPFGKWSDETVSERSGTLSDGQISDGRILSAREYANLPTYEIKWNGKWGNFLNSIGQNDILMIYGGQGSGKSHLASQLASELGSSYNVLYVVAEEGVSSHVQERFIKYQFPKKNIDVVAERSHKRLLKAVKSKNYNFIIIDSLQGLGLSYEAQAPYLEQLVRETSIHGLIFLNQMNKSGEFKGMQELGHLTSAEIKVEDGIAITVKNRQSPEKPKMEVFGDYQVEKVLRMDKAVNY